MMRTEIPYFISMERYAEAENKAQEMNLKPKQWVFVSVHSYYRFQVIEKYRNHNIPPDHLIGQFDEDEIIWLTGR